MSQPPLPRFPLNYVTPDPFGSAGPVKNPNRFRNGLIGWAIFILLAVMLVFLTQQNKRVVPEIPLDEFYEHLLAGDVVLDGQFRSPNTLAGKALPNGRFHTQLPPGTIGNWAFTEWLLENRHGAQLNVSNDPSFVLNLVVPLIPWFLIFGFIWFFLARVMRKVGSPRPTLLAGPIEVIVKRERK
jgi:ATP-dependent Zn protease